MEEWNRVWQALDDRGSAPWRGAAAHGEREQMRKITVGDLRRAARSFKERTGVGIDGIAPRQLDWLSDALLERVIELLEVIEEGGAWLGNAASALMHLIPKPQGGRRPIAIIATLIRVWVKCRKEEVREWKETCLRGYDWMGPGKGAEKAVWTQSAREEAMAQRGKATASVLFDLVKGIREDSAG